MYTQVDYFYTFPTNDNVVYIITNSYTIRLLRNGLRVFPRIYCSLFMDRIFNVGLASLIEVGIPTEVPVNVYLLRCTN